MSTLEALVDGLWSFLAMGLLHGTVLAAITWLLSRTILRRARPALMTALWTLVLLKFLVPVGPGMPGSLSAMVEALLQPGALPAEVPVVALAERAVDVPAAAMSTPAWTLVKSALIVIYLVLVVFLVVRCVLVQRRHRRWARSVPAAEGAVLAVVARAARKVGLRRVPRVHVSDAVGAPQIIGLWRPVLLVPAELVAEPAALEATLLHELAHLRRHDTWLRGLQLTAAIALFFWPVIRWVNRRIDDHREMACDQWAIAWGPLSAGAYARVLVALARRAQSAPQGHGAARLSLGGVLLGLAMVRGKKQLHARVDALFGGRPRPRIGLVSGLCLCLWSLVSLAGAGEGRAQAAADADECVIMPEIVEYILAAHPEADIDGDGVLSHEEVCAYQRRLRELGALDDALAHPADTLVRDTLLASLDATWLECATCTCAADEPGPESVLQPLDKRVCSNEQSP